MRGLVWRLGRHGSARGWLMAERSCSQHAYYIVVHCTTRSTAFMCAFWAVYKCSEALYVDFRSILVGPERRSHRYKRKVDQQSARTWPPYRHDNPWTTRPYYAVLPVVQTGFGLTTTRTRAVRADRRSAHIGQGAGAPTAAQKSEARTSAAPPAAQRNQINRFAARRGARVPFAARSDCRLRAAEIYCR